MSVEEKPLVPCLFEIDGVVCGKELKSLAAHIKVKHGLTIAEYREITGSDEIGYLSQPGERTTGPDAFKRHIDPETGGPRNPLDTTLSPVELNYFNQRKRVLFISALEDADLEAFVRDIAYNEVLIMRYQQKLGSKRDMAPAEIKTFTEVLTKLQDSNARSLKELNLTSVKKAELNKTPETTPSRLITAYALAQSQMTPKERERQLKDEAEAYARLEKNKNELKNLIPSAVGYTDSNEIEIDE